MNRALLALAALVILVGGGIWGVHEFKAKQPVATVPCVTGAATPIATPVSAVSPQTETFQPYVLVKTPAPVPAHVTDYHRHLTLKPHDGEEYLADDSGRYYHIGRDATGHIYPAYYDQVTDQTYPLYYDPARDDYYRVCRSDNHYYSCYVGDPQSRFYECDYDDVNYSNYPPPIAYCPVITDPYATFTCYSEPSYYYDPVEYRHRWHGNDWWFAAPVVIGAYFVLDEHVSPGFGFYYGYNSGPQCSQTVLALNIFNAPVTYYQGGSRYAFYASVMPPARYMVPRQQWPHYAAIYSQNHGGSLPGYHGSVQLAAVPGGRGRGIWTSGRQRTAELVGPGAMVAAGVAGNRYQAGHPNVQTANGRPGFNGGKQIAAGGFNRAGANQTGRPMTAAENGHNRQTMVAGNTTQRTGKYAGAAHAVASNNAATHRGNPRTMVASNAHHTVNMAPSHQVAANHAANGHRFAAASPMRSHEVNREAANTVRHTTSSYRPRVQSAANTPRSVEGANPRASGTGGYHAREYHVAPSHSEAAPRTFEGTEGFGGGGHYTAPRSTNAPRSFNEPRRMSQPRSFDQPRSSGNASFGGGFQSHESAPRSFSQPSGGFGGGRGQSFGGGSHNAPSGGGGGRSRDDHKR